MSRTTAPNRRRKPEPKPARGPSVRWRIPYPQIGLVLLSVLLLSLALAPVKQFYLAWIGLVPLLLVMARSGSRKAAFGWGFAGGLLFFVANMWWLAFVSAPGLVALTVYLSLFWGAAGLVSRDAYGFLLLPPDPPAGAPPDAGDSRPRQGFVVPVLVIFTIAFTWSGLEWMRGNISFLGRQGLPWLYLGQTQSPVLVMCQVADVFGITGVSFWVLLTNALVAGLLLRPHHLPRMMPAIAAVVAVLLGVGVYGAFRMGQDVRHDGPTVMVVQSDYKQSNTGQKGASLEEIVQFHVDTTRRALRETLSNGRTVDLVVWSETMMPPLNEEALAAYQGTGLGELSRVTREVIADIAAEFGTAMLVGGSYHADVREQGEFLVPGDRRNSAYYFDRQGRLRDERYDKIHLVPFGEYIPFKHSIPPLYRLFIKLGPNYYEEYALTRGEGFTVFPLQSGGDGGVSARFVVPICFEDIVPGLVARMVSGGDGGKRADLLVNITNDGWFRANQMPQHLQAAVFRSIENRVPTARSVNTGVSGFIDSLGRVSQTVASDTEGWSVETLSLDHRVAPYTRIGDAFALSCVAVMAAACAVGWTKRRAVQPRP
jgi:apolipoprotein N-acyltransferase